MTTRRANRCHNVFRVNRNINKNRTKWHDISISVIHPIHLVHVCLQGQILSPIFELLRIAVYIETSSCDLDVAKSLCILCDISHETLCTTLLIFSHVANLTTNGCPELRCAACMYRVRINAFFDALRVYSPSSEFQWPGRIRVIKVKLYAFLKIRHWEVRVGRLCRYAAAVPRGHKVRWYLTLQPPNQLKVNFTAVYLGARTF